MVSDKKSAFKRGVRVLHVGPGWGQRGGIASVVAELASQRERFSNVGLAFVFFETHGFQRALHLIAFALLDIPRFMLAMTRNVDIVHFHVSVRGSFYRKAILCALARLTGRKTVFHLHAGNFTRFASAGGRFTRRMILWFIRDADAVVAVSTTTAEELRALGAHRDKVHVIANTAISAERAADTRLSRANESVTAPRIVFAGRLAEAKGIDDLLNAVALLKRQGCVVHLKLAGDGDIGRWKSCAVAYGIDDLVSFPGWLGDEDKIALYGGARVFCMPSHYESFGIATLEAMFAGVPVVGTRVGGFLDLVDEEVTGFLVPTANPNALASRLRPLLEDEALARRMGRAARIRAQQQFSSAAVIGQYKRCYQAVMEGGGTTQ